MSAPKHLLILTTLGAMAAASLAAAQAPEISAEALATRLDGELACATARRDELTRGMVLLEQARDQLRAPGASAAARADAVQAANTLEDSVMASARALAACISTGRHAAAGTTPPPATTRPATPTRVVETVIVDSGRERIGGSDAALEPRQTTIARPMTDSVSIVTGRQVDGTGTIGNELVNLAVTRVGESFEECVTRANERGDRVPETLEIVFTVNASGQTVNRKVESPNRGAEPFRRCVAQAAHSINVGSRPRGGDSATYSYQLRFGR